MNRETLLTNGQGGDSMALRQGDSYQLPIKIMINGVLLDMGLVTKVEFMFDNIRKVYGEDSTDGVIYSEDHFIVPLSQEETFSLKDKTVDYQARVKFTSGEVKGTPIKRCNIYESISQEVL